MVWIINDEPCILETQLDVFFNNFPNETFLGFEDYKQAHTSNTTRPNFILIDIGMLSISSNELSDEIIESLFENYSSATIFLYSAMDVWAKDYVEKLQEDYPVIFMPFNLQEASVILAQYGVGN